MTVSGGATQPVYLVTQNDLDTGRYRIEHGSALRVYGFNLVLLMQTGRALEQGNRIPIYVVPNEELRENGGIFRVEGGEALPISDVLENRPVIGRIAIPVYVVNSNEWPAASTCLVQLNWDDNSDDEDGFRIERSTNGIDYTEIATVGAGVTSHQEEQAAGQTLWYRVRAYNENGNSNYSNVAQLTT